MPSAHQMLIICKHYPFSVFLFGSESRWRQAKQSSSSLCPATFSSSSRANGIYNPSWVSCVCHGVSSQFGCALRPLKTRVLEASLSDGWTTSTGSFQREEAPVLLRAPHLISNCEDPLRVAWCSPLFIFYGTKVNRFSMHERVIPGDVGLTSDAKNKGVEESPCIRDLVLSVTTHSSWPYVRFLYQISWQSSQ